MTISPARGMPCGRAWAYCRGLTLGWSCDAPAPCAVRRQYPSWISRPLLKRLQGVTKVGVAELLFFLRREVMAGDEAAVGKPKFSQTDLDQFGFDAVDGEHQSGVIVISRSSSSGVGIAARMS